METFFKVLQPPLEMKKNWGGNLNEKKNGKNHPLYKTFPTRRLLDVRIFNRQLCGSFIFFCVLKKFLEQVFFDEK